MDTGLVYRFQSAFNELNSTTIDQGLLEQIYSPDVRFIDPLHTLSGLDELKQYFQKMYQNVLSIHFQYGDPLMQDDHAVLFWTMTFRHPKLRNGREIKVEGCSLVRFRDDKVVFHRDYLDTSQMLFRHIPVIGNAIDFISKKAAGQ